MGLLVEDTETDILILMAASSGAKHQCPCTPFFQQGTTQRLGQNEINERLERYVGAASPRCGGEPRHVCMSGRFAAPAQDRLLEDAGTRASRRNVPLARILPRVSLNAGDCLRWLPPTPNPEQPR